MLSNNIALQYYTKLLKIKPATLKSQFPYVPMDETVIQTIKKIKIVGGTNHKITIICP